MRPYQSISLVLHDNWLKLQRTRFEDLDDRLQLNHLFLAGNSYVEAEMEAFYFGGPFGARVFYSLN